MRTFLVSRWPQLGHSKVYRSWWGFSVPSMPTRRYFTLHREHGGNGGVPLRFYSADSVKRAAHGYESSREAAMAAFAKSWATGINPEP
jgi:hypothetical protein